MYCTMQEQVTCIAQCNLSEACNCMYVCKQSCKHTGTTCKCIWAAMLVSKASSTFHCQVSLPALQVPANNQSMAASSLDPEVAFGLQKAWVSPRLERPWVGTNAVSLIPEGATEEQVIEALELWGMPVEAWPKTGKKEKC